VVRSKKVDSPDPWLSALKKAKTSTVIAVKALACKLAKAAWHVMAEQVNYDETRVFPELAMNKKN
jgi:hypothetical protein